MAKPSHYGKKITLEKAEQIRARHAQGEKVATLVKAFGLSKVGIYRLLRGDSWQFTVKLNFSREEWDWLSNKAMDRGCNIESVIRSLVFPKCHLI